MPVRSPEAYAEALARLEDRSKALERLLVEKAYVDPAALTALVTAYEHEIGPERGARVVARAWRDPEFKARLLAEGTAACAELGYGGRQGEHLIVLEATPARHPCLVASLGSGYPWPVLGLPPAWWRAPAFRARAVMDPRGVLADFGVLLDEATAVTVVDVTAEIRYCVLPQRPAGTEALDEAALAGLVTREAMLGWGVVSAPGPAGAAP